MKKYINFKSLSSFALTLLQLETAVGGTKVNGTTVQFTSTKGVVESCVALNKFPLGVYSDKDQASENTLCSIDFYNNSVALCPKTWSTSAGTIVNDNSSSGKLSVESEKVACAKSSPLKSIAKFKQTMNQVDTSGTNSMSPILYYHFSRILNATVDVPVAVFRTMDKNEHYQRVTSKAKPSASAKMNFAAWAHMRNAELNPAGYKAASTLFDSSLSQIYGTLFKDKGERYGSEIIGTRARGWGKGQNYDFQNTPGFLALRSKKEMPLAIDDGIDQAFVDPAMKKAFAGHRPSKIQMTLWMKELSEIVILDYIFNQQDRVGNIDYSWHWVFIDKDGNVKTKKADSEVGLLSKETIRIPEELRAFQPSLVQKSSIGDNDAGALRIYANYTKITQMLEGIRHLHPDTYRRLFRLALDLENKRENYQNLEKNFDLDSSTMELIVQNTKAAATILLKSCESKALEFDIVDLKTAAKQEFSNTTLDCRNP
ncbi:MAG: hypothetical protein IPM97_08360 [Bdellovibrionaceae bacterium]|nr:hypothetical protein [Pseudobdellovibrionaceae bacterium]